MSLPGSFVRAWYEWQHLPVISVARGEESLDKIIYGLEHLGVYTLGQKAIEGEKLYPVEAAFGRLSELEAIEAELENCSASESVKGEIKNHIETTRTLLIELTRLS
ncbi:MAG TPA: hypothetical protein VGW12_07140 [Pyrinomonadaceae bacterium]|nr:hypothetical protein [Pyrinomonadaceae bacterium]